MAVGFVRAQARPVVPRQPVFAGPGRLRKIALLGSHELSLKDAPWGDPSWEFWGHASSRGLYLREPDRYFDRHRKECWTKSNNKGKTYLRWLERNRVPIYMLEKFGEVPASIRYPFEQVSFGMARKYFTNHAAYMIALALMEGCTHLGFFGVKLRERHAEGRGCGVRQSARELRVLDGTRRSAWRATHHPGWVFAPRRSQGTVRA